VHSFCSFSSCLFSSFADQRVLLSSISLFRSSLRRIDDERLPVSLPLLVPVFSFCLPSFLILPFLLLTCLCWESCTPDDCEFPFALMRRFYSFSWTPAADTEPLKPSSLCQFDLLCGHAPHVASPPSRLWPTLQITTLGPSCPSVFFIYSIRWGTPPVTPFFFSQCILSFSSLPLTIPFFFPLGC